MALRAWYRHIRTHFAVDSNGRACLKGALSLLSNAVAERHSRLQETLSRCQELSGTHLKMNKQPPITSLLGYDKSLRPPEPYKGEGIKEPILGINGNK